MSEQNKAISRRVLNELWNKRNAALIDEIYAPNVVIHTPDGDLHGHDGCRQLYDTYMKAFPDCHFDIGEMIAEGDLVATPYTFKGTHTGDLVGIAPTGTQVTNQGIAIARFEGGRVVEEQVIWDTLSLMQQLGVVPVPEHTAG